MPVVSIALDEPISEHHRPPGALGYFRVMGNEDDGDALGIQIVKDVQDLFS